MQRRLAVAITCETRRPRFSRFPCGTLRQATEFRGESGRLEHPLRDSGNPCELPIRCAVLRTLCCLAAKEFLAVHSTASFRIVISDNFFSPLGEPYRDFASRLSPDSICRADCSVASDDTSFQTFVLPEGNEYFTRGLNMRQASTVDKSEFLL